MYVASMMMADRPLLLIYRANTAELLCPNILRYFSAASMITEICWMPSSCPGSPMVSSPDYSASYRPVRFNSFFAFIPCSLVGWTLPCPAIIAIILSTDKACKY